MQSFGVLDNPVDYTLGVYFHHCAIAMSCRQLAMAGRYLAHSGRNPATGFSVVSAERARRINALMLTCGHYDGSGEFAYRVGLPGKSGVGGGILAVVPGKASIAVWSPGLDASGNSHLGDRAGNAGQADGLVDLRRVREQTENRSPSSRGSEAVGASQTERLSSCVWIASSPRLVGDARHLLGQSRAPAYRENFLYFSRCGMTLSMPSRRFLSSS